MKKSGLTSYRATIHVAEIQAIGPLRQVNAEVVDELAVSMTVLGLQTPIVVRMGKEDPDGSAPVLLVAGQHRLAAAKRLGWEHVEVQVVDAHDEVEYELIRISENLHRAELTKLERGEQTARWVALAGARRARKADRSAPGESGVGGVSSQVATKLRGGRPESGLREAARELGRSKDEVHRAVLIAAIAPEAKKAAREAGLDDNQRALLRIAKSNDQCAEVANINAERAKRAPVAGGTPKNRARPTDDAGQETGQGKNPSGSERREIRSEGEPGTLKDLEFADRQAIKQMGDRFNLLSGTEARTVALSHLWGLASQEERTGALGFPGKDAAA